MGMAEHTFQDEARKREGLLLLLLQSNRQPGTGILQCRGHDKQGGD